MPRTVPCTVKINAFIKKRAVVLIRKIILPLISLFSKLVTCTLIPVTNICLGELSVAHKASISSFSFNIICAVVTFQHVEKVFPDRCFS